MSREDDGAAQRGARSILAHAGCVHDQSVFASFRNDVVRVLCRTLCIQQSIFELVSVQPTPLVNLPGAVEATSPKSRDDHSFGPVCSVGQVPREGRSLSLIHISEPTRLGMISYAVFCLKKKK